MLPPNEKEELATRSKTPHLSHSRINRYLTCPEQYRLYYIENMRLKCPSASLVFGQIVHQALADLFTQKSDPVDVFQKTWNELKEIKLTYSKKESWEKLNDSGQGLLKKFVKEELPRIGQVRAVEKKFKLNIEGFDLPFIGVINLVAEVNGKMTVVDHKTAGASYDDHESAMSDQLTAYKLAEPEVEEMALCVLVKTKEPQIEWHPTTRSPVQMHEYLAKAEYVAREISGARFYKRPGIWCTWCDFLPICMNDQKKISETLVQVR